MFPFPCHFVLYLCNSVSHFIWATVVTFLVNWEIEISLCFASNRERFGRMLCAFFLVFENARNWRWTVRSVLKWWKNICSVSIPRNIRRSTHGALDPGHVPWDGASFQNPPLVPVREFVSTNSVRVTDTFMMIIICALLVIVEAKGPFAVLSSVLNGLCWWLNVSDVSSWLFVRGRIMVLDCWRTHCCAAWIWVFMRVPILCETAEMPLDLRND